MVGKKFSHLLKIWSVFTDLFITAKVSDSAWNSRRSPVIVRHDYVRIQQESFSAGHNDRQAFKIQKLTMLFKQLGGKIFLWVFNRVLLNCYYLSSWLH